MRRHGLFRIARAVAEDERGDQRRYTGVDMDHGTTGKVESAHFKEQSAASPDHMRDREIDDGQPDRAEHHDRGKFHPLDNRPEHKRQGDGREGHLEGDEHIFRDHFVGEGRRRARTVDASEEKLAPADEGIAFRTESQAITIDDPDQHRETGRGADLRHRRQHILGPGQTAVKEGKTGKDHQQDQYGCRHHPGVIAGIGDGRSRLDGLLRKGWDGQAGERRHPRHFCQNFSHEYLLPRLYCCVAGFARADADGVFETEREDLAITDRFRTRCGLDRLNRLRRDIAAAGDLDLQFRHHVRGIFRAAIDFRLALLPAEALDLGYGHTGHPDPGQRFTNIVKLERFDYGYDKFHYAPYGCCIGTHRKARARISKRWIQRTFTKSACS